MKPILLINDFNNADFRDRPCESPDQTMFQDVCTTFGKPGSPCKDDSLQLYDGPDNRGVCDCKFQDSSRPYNGLIYSSITESCHVQNSRVSFLGSLDSKKSHIYMDCDL